jgi:hypothetical protein
MLTGFIWLGTGFRDFYHSEPLKKHRAGKQLVADVKVTCRLQTLYNDFFCASL